MPRYLPAGDGALVVEFGDGIDPALSARVLRLEAAIARRGVPGVLETVPTFRSLLVEYDPLVLSGEALRRTIEQLEDGSPPLPAPGGSSWTLPVLYGGAAGPDLDAVAWQSGMSTAEVVALHTQVPHRVAMLGNLPGLPYLLGLPRALTTGRRADPRDGVPPGSVAMASGMTCIYPVAGPGGWQLVGRTPARLFDPGRRPPALLAPGDSVRFTAVDAGAFASLSERADGGDWQPQPDS